jgi:Transglycosylase-like domain
LTVVLTALAFMLPISEQADHRWRTVRPYNAKLERIARCETRGIPVALRWRTNTGNGFYGGLQFTLSTWKSVGGRGYPHRNSKLEQKFRAVKLIKKSGYGPWPICGSA